MNGLVHGVLFLKEHPVQGATALVAVVQGADVTTGTEGLLAGTLEDHAFDIIVPCPVVHLLMDGLHHVQGQGIQSAGAIQGQVAKAAPNLDDDIRLVIGHVLSFI